MPMQLSLFIHRGGVQEASAVASGQVKGGTAYAICDARGSGRRELRLGEGWEMT